VSVIRSSGNGQKMVFSTLSGDMEEPHYPGKSNSLIFFARLACLGVICVTGNVFGEDYLLLLCLVVGFGLWVLLYLMLSGYVSFTCHTNREALFYIHAHACANTHMHFTHAYYKMSVFKVELDKYWSSCFGRVCRIMFGL